MADRVMSLRQSSGSSFGNEIPIGTEAKYVDVVTSTGTKTLQAVLGENIGGGGTVESRLSAAETKLSGIAEGANKTTVDSSLSSSSTNPVQNKVINTALAGKLSTSGGTVSGDLTANRIITKNIGNKVVPSSMPSGASYNGTIELNPLMPASNTDDRDLVQPVISLNRNYNEDGNSNQESNVLINSSNIKFTTDGSKESYYTLVDESNNPQHYFNGQVTMNDSLRALDYYVADDNESYQLIADHVIESYMDNAWHIVKWASGRVEMTAYRAYSNMSCDTAFGSWYKTSTDLGANVTYPSGLLTDIWMFNVTPCNSNPVYLPICQRASGYTKVGSVWLISPTKVTLYTPSLFFHVIGKWK